MSLFVLSFLAALPSAPGEGTLDKDTIAVIRDGHRQSREAIRSLEVHFEVHSSPITPAERQASPATKVKMDWYERDGKIRCARSADGNTADYLWKGGELKMLENQKDAPQKLRLVGSLGPRKVLSRFLDPWFAALLCVPSTPDKSFDQALEDLSGIEELKPVQVGGRTIYHVRFTTLGGAQKQKKIQNEAWFDPSSNYLVRKAIYSSGSVSIEQEVLAFQEVKQGLFFPTLIEQRTFNDGKQTTMNRFTFTTIHINDPIPDKLFDLRFPAGTAVADLHQNVGYVTGADEKPATQIVPLNTEHPIVAAARKAQERQNYIWMIVSVGLIVLLGGSLWIAWRRVSARRA